MRSGRLKKRLILQSPTITRDSYGDAIPGWSTNTTVWGSLLPLSGNEYFSQQAVQAEAQVRVIIRYNSSITTAWRISHGGKYYAIVDIANENKRDRMLTIMCREGVADDYGTDTSYNVTNISVNVTNSGVQVTNTP